MMQSSDDIGPILLQALGVPTQGVFQATITLAVGEPIVVEISRFAEFDPAAIDSDLLSMIMSRYRLVAAEDASDRPAIETL